MVLRGALQVVNVVTIMSNPLAGAIAGIAVLVVKKLMQRNNQGNSGQYGNIRPASEDPYKDPADQQYR